MAKMKKIKNIEDLTKAVDILKSIADDRIEKMTAPMYRKLVDLRAQVTDIEASLAEEDKVFQAQEAQIMEGIAEYMGTLPAEVKSVKTPNGVVKTRSSSSLIIGDPKELLKMLKTKKLKECIRQMQEEPDKTALRKLDPAVLTELGVTIETKSSVSVELKKTVDVKTITATGLKTVKEAS